MIERSLNALVLSALANSVGYR